MGQRVTWNSLKNIQDYELLARLPQDHSLKELILPLFFTNSSVYFVRKLIFSTSAISSRKNKSGLVIAIKQFAVGFASVDILCWQELAFDSSEVATPLQTKKVVAKTKVKLAFNAFWIIIGCLYIPLILELFSTICIPHSGDLFAQFQPPFSPN